MKSTAFELGLIRPKRLNVTLREKGLVTHGTKHSAVRKTLYFFFSFFFKFIWQALSSGVNKLKVHGNKPYENPRDRKT